jgi:hypothetical protein
MRKPGKSVLVHFTWKYWYRHITWLGAFLHRATSLINAYVYTALLTMTSGQQSGADDSMSTGNPLYQAHAKGMVEEAASGRAKDVMVGLEKQANVASSTWDQLQESIQPTPRLAALVSSTITCEATVFLSALLCIRYYLDSYCPHKLTHGARLSPSQSRTRLSVSRSLRRS